MITKVVIRDNQKSPIRYIVDLKSFENGTEYNFKPGVNIIVGENGCGKTTLLNLIRRYLMVDETECSRGEFNHCITRLYRGLNYNILNDGIDVYADYQKNTFRLCHSGEKSENSSLKTFADFGELYSQKISSTGEGVVIALNSLFSYMFSKNAKLTFNYEQFKDNYPTYYDYVNNHRVKCENEFTILMDEPDRNLSLENLLYIKEILSFHKEYTQIIAVIHNPLLISALTKIENINFIEMTENYIYKINSQLRKLIKV